MYGYHQKAQNFKMNIRMSAREKIRSEKRRVFHFGCPPITQIARSLDLPPATYTLQQLIDQRKDQLVNRTLTLKQKFGQVHQYMQNLYPITIPLEGHLNFWSLAVEQLYTDKYLPTEFFFHFLEEYINLNAHRQIAFNKNYELKVLNTLDLSAASKMPRKLKKKMIQWVEGTQGITLLNNCISKQFLDLETYQNVYFILIEGLKEKVFDKDKHKKNVQECISILISICKQADMDELDDLLRQHPAITNSLMQIALKQMHENDQTILILATDAILTFLNTYAETVLSYAQLGVAYLSGVLISSNREICIMKGLQILRVLCQVQIFDMIKFLLDEDGQFCKTGIWQKFRVGNYIYKSRNLNIRKNLYGILANMFASGQFQQTLKLSEMISLENFNVLDLMKEAMEDEDEQSIIQNIISIISLFLYYGDQQKEGDVNQILQIIKAKGIDKSLELKMDHTNKSIRDKVEKVLEGIKSYGNDSQI